MQSIYEHLSDEEESESGRSPLPPPLLPPPRRAVPLSAAEMAAWRWANVENVDLYLQRVYEYYTQHGFYCIILARALQMATVAFVVWFGTYVFSCIDYGKLRHAPSFADARVSRCIAHTSWAHYLALWIFSVGWILKLFQYVGDVKELWEMHEFYRWLLNLSENDLQTVSWPQVVSRLVGLQHTNGAAGGRPLEVQEIVNRIMRKENYFIALYNKDIFDLNVKLLPFLSKAPFLTRVLDFSIFLCLDDYLFNGRNHVRRVVLKESKRDMLASGLRRRFRFAALMNVVLAPVALVYTMLYYFFRHFNEYYSTPRSLGSRQYTPLAEWRMRTLNELYHLFRRRLYQSEPAAQKYISQFPRHKTAIALKFVIFVLSAFAAVLLSISVYDSELLSLELKLTLTSLGLAIVIARSMLPEPSEQATYDPETCMLDIVNYTQYLPQSWEDRLHTEWVKQQFCELYDLKVKIILREILGLVVGPYILWFKLAECSERIVDFVRENSTHLDAMGGCVCSLAIFQPDGQSQDGDEVDETMLKSYHNFVDVYGHPQAIPGSGSIAPSPDATSDEEFGVMGLLNNLYKR